MAESSSKSSAQRAVDRLGPMIDLPEVEGLFRPSTTYGFNLPNDYRTVKLSQQKSIAEQIQTHHETSDTAYDRILSAEYGRAETYQRESVHGYLREEYPVFVRLTTIGWQQDALSVAWFERFLTVVADSWKIAQSEESRKTPGWGPCVLIRPILKERGRTPAGYFLCPAEVSTVAKHWTDLGFRNPYSDDYLTTPLYPRPTDGFLQIFTSPAGGFAIPSELSIATPNQFLYYWASFAEINFPTVKPLEPAVPQQPHSFGAVSGQNINISVGGAASMDVSDFTPPTFEGPLTKEQLRFVARGGRNYFGDHPVAEPDNKLAAAIGTAAAAAITVGVAAALS